MKLLKNNKEFIGGKNYVNKLQKRAGENAPLNERINANYQLIGFVQTMMEKVV